MDSHFAKKGNTLPLYCRPTRLWILSDSEGTLGTASGRVGVQTSVARPLLRRGSRAPINPAWELLPANRLWIALRCPDEVYLGVKDPTYELRKRRSEEINSNPRTREELEKEFGTVWSSKEMGTEFIVDCFLSPLVIVRRRSDGVKGSLLFQHSPRFYFRFFRDDTLWAK